MNAEKILLKSFLDYSRERTGFEVVEEDTDDFENGELLQENQSEITKDFLRKVIDASRKKFTDDSNSNKAIIRVPSGTSDQDIRTFFQSALKVMKSTWNDISVDGNTIKLLRPQQGSGSGAYAAVIGHKRGETPPDNGFRQDGSGFRVFISDKEGAAGAGGGGGGGTPKAADYEAAICVEYNIKKGKSLEDALKITFANNAKKIEDYKKKANPEAPKGQETRLTLTGRKVAEKLSGPGTLVHSGTGLSGLDNKYEGGADKTPKTDIIGGDDNGAMQTTKDYRYSLKKVDHASGAQLMSGKSAESRGVFKSCWKTLGAKTDGNDELSKKMNEMLKSMKKKLSDNIKTTVGISDIKKEYSDWLKKKFEKGHRDAASNRGEVRNNIIKENKSSTVNGKKYVWIPANSNNGTFKTHADYVITQKDNSKKIEGYVFDQSKIPEDAIYSYIVAQSRLSGLLPVLGKPLMYMIYQTIYDHENEEWSIGEPIDVISDGKYELRRESKKLLHEHFIAGKNKEMQDSTTEIMKASLDGKVLRGEIAKEIQNNTGLKRLIVFEASSGWYKFTGEPLPYDNGEIKDEDANQAPVAYNMLEFNDNGLVKIEQISTFANNNYDLVKRLYVAFKGSGDTRYTSIRLPSPSATKESVEQDFSLFSLIEDCVEHNFTMMNQDILMEKLWGRVKGALQRAGAGVSQFVRSAAAKAAQVASATKRVVGNIVQKGARIIGEIVSFGKKLVQAAINSVKQVVSIVGNILKEGISKFLGFLGLGEPEGDFSF